MSRSLDWPLGKSYFCDDRNPVMPLTYPGGSAVGKVPATNSCIEKFTESLSKSLCVMCTAALIHRWSVGTSEEPERKRRKFTADSGVVVNGLGSQHSECGSGLEKSREC